MLEFKQSSGILIPREFENEEFYKNIKSHLTRVVRDFTGVNLTTLKFYIEGDKFLKVPRFFPIEAFVECSLKNTLSSGEDIEISHNIKLRDDTQKNAVNYFLSNENGVIQAPPGSGKTVMTIYMVAERKKKTFILVHRDSLVEQWQDRFVSYSSIKSEDVVRLTSKTFKEDLKKPVIISTDQTFISLLKRNRIEFLTELEKAGIGILIADEVHTSVGAPTFAECSVHIPAKYVFGLSATPYRNDGNSDIINYHLGDVFVPGGTASVMRARVTVMCYPYGILSGKSRRYVFWNGELNRARYLNMVAKSPMVEKVSRSILNKFHKENRNILYVAERIKLLDKMFDLMPGSSKSKFIGSADNSALRSKAVFATIGKVRDGVDASHLDCLIITSPVANIEQLAGRVTRIKDGKNIPVIIDMVDTEEAKIYKTVHNRIRYYKKENWEIQYILLNEDDKWEVLTEEKFRNKF